MIFNPRKSALVMLKSFWNKQAYSADLTEGRLTYLLKLLLLLDSIAHL